MPHVTDERFGIPILPRHGVVVWTPGDDKQAVRFARLFREAWKHLPLYARRRILGHWRDDDAPRIFGMVYSPLIHLEDDWDGRKRGRGLRGDLGMVHREGHMIHFWTKIVAAFPDELVRDLIAHELAHVHQFACGWDFDDSYEREEEADRRGELWGFSSTAMDEWMLEHGHTRVIDPATLSPATIARYKRESRRSGRGAIL